MYDKKATKQVKGSNISLVGRSGTLKEKIDCKILSLFGQLTLNLSTSSIRAVLPSLTHD